MKLILSSSSSSSSSFFYHEVVAVEPTVDKLLSGEKLLSTEKSRSPFSLTVKY